MSASERAQSRLILRAVAAHLIGDQQRVKPQGEKIVAEKRRYVLGRGLKQDPAFRTFQPYGIEGSAQRAALMHGDNTIAVLASGVDRAYPVGHADLIESIAHRGLVLTEAPPASAPTRQRLLDRSRILAALSGATVIVEAGFRSGTLQTAREASLLGRFVGAVPGPVTSAASAGTNRLLQDGRARVVTCGPDVVRMLGDNTSAPERNAIRPGAPHVVSPNTRVL